jgi:hypothetical protein
MTLQFWMLVLLFLCGSNICYKVGDVANIAEHFASDLSYFVNGQHLLLNGGDASHKKVCFTFYQTILSFHHLL